MEGYERDHSYRYVTQQQERCSFLMEYARKIYQERQSDFSWIPDKIVQRLYIPTPRLGEYDAQLEVATDAQGNMRGAMFEIELLTDKPHADRYKFSYMKPMVLSKEMWCEDRYEPASYDDEVGQEEVAYDIERVLMNTMVERPVTSLKDEREFWQIAIATSVEEFEQREIEVVKYFEKADESSRHQRIELAFRAIWGAAYKQEYDGKDEWMREALGEDVALYCRRRMRR